MSHRAEEKKISQHYLVQRIADYLPLADITSILPSSVIDRGAPTDTDNITWADFDHFLLGRELHKCIVVCYITGFQIWDIEDRHNIHEIFSVRDIPIKCIKALPSPLPPEGHEFHSGDVLREMRPCVIVASAQETQDFSLNDVKIYSLVAKQYVHRIRFPKEVLAIATSSTDVVFVMSDEQHVYDALTMKPRLTIRTAPSPHSEGVYALGAQWLATATAEPVGGYASSNQDSTGLIGDVVGYLGKGVAKLAKTGVLGNVVASVSSGISYLGEKGRAAIYNYKTKTDTLSPPRTHSTAESGTKEGIVKVTDLKQCAVIAHFRAHAHPISALAFDPSGSLLVTSSAIGHNFVVFRITPTGDPLASHQPLYKLVRGVTNTRVLSLAVSPDMKWVAACSFRGTAHVYSLTDSHSAIDETRAPSVRVLSAAARIRLRLLNRKDIRPKALFYPPPVPGDPQQLACVTHQGLLTMHSLHPPTDREPQQQGLVVEGGGGWDLCRRRDWPQLVPDLTVSQPSSKLVSRPENWVSALEAVTHASPWQPLWLRPQIKLKVIDRTAIDDDPSPIAHTQLHTATHTAADPTAITNPHTDPRVEGTRTQTGTGAHGDSWDGGRTLLISHRPPVPSSSTVDPGTCVNDLDLDALLVPARPDESAYGGNLGLLSESIRQAKVTLQDARDAPFSSMPPVPQDGMTLNLMGPPPSTQLREQPPAMVRMDPQSMLDAIVSENLDNLDLAEDDAPLSPHTSTHPHPPTLSPYPTLEPTHTPTPPHTREASLPLSASVLSPGPPGDPLLRNTTHTQAQAQAHGVLQPSFVQEPEGMRIDLGGDAMSRDVQMSAGPASPISHGPAHTPTPPTPPPPAPAPDTHTHTDTDTDTTADTADTDTQPPAASHLTKSQRRRRNRRSPGKEPTAG